MNYVQSFQPVSPQAKQQLLLRQRELHNLSTHSWQNAFELAMIDMLARDLKAYNYKFEHVKNQRPALAMHFNPETLRLLTQPATFAEVQEILLPLGAVILDFQSFEKREPLTDHVETQASLTEILSRNCKSPKCKNSPLVSLLVANRILASGNTHLRAKAGVMGAMPAEKCEDIVRCFVLEELKIDPTTQEGRQCVLALGHDIFKSNRLSSLLNDVYERDPFKALLAAGFLNETDEAAYRLLHKPRGRKRRA